MRKIVKFFLTSVCSFILLFLPAVSEASRLGLFMQQPDFMLYVVIAFMAFVLAVLLYLAYVLRMFFKYALPEKKQTPLFTGIIHSLTDTVPVDQEQVILTDHDYDGIRELDNNLPPWWKYLFYATIVIAVMYIYYYHFSGKGQLQTEEYKQELADADLQMQEYRKHHANSIDEHNVIQLKDAAAVANGKVLFVENCSPCHGNNGEGGLGPNLTDEYWLHGGKVNDVFTTIKYGVPQKGMISWKAQLNPLNIQEVTSYIISIQGSAPANAKAPQGDKE